MSEFLNKKSNKLVDPWVHANGDHSMVASKHISYVNIKFCNFAAKSTTQLPLLRFKRSEHTESVLDPFADAVLDVAFSHEELPLDRYPKRSRNRVSEGF